MNDATEVETIEVWLVTDADDHRAMHEMLALYADGTCTVFETVGWKPERPVERLLAVAGFTGGSGASPLSVKTLSCETPIVQLKGFSAPASFRVDVEMTIRAALTGDLGGFSPVAAGQSGYHRVEMAFEQVWAAAGRPPVRARHPHLVQGVSATAAGPCSIRDSAAENERLSAVLRLGGEGQTPDQEESTETLSR